MTQLDLFLACPPGLEAILEEEAQSLGFVATPTAGGVEFSGSWDDMMRANLWCRGATRVLLRLGSFRAFHLAQLDKRARKFDWGAWLLPDTTVSVEVVTGKRNKIYHAGAAKERIERAIHEELGCPIAETGLAIKVRIEDNTVLISLDTSGEPLHKRGFKTAVGKAPLRETMAALLLRGAGYRGTEPVVDPMCGSGTLVIEAAEMAAGLAAGRGRHFSFEQLKGFDPNRLAQVKGDGHAAAHSLHFYGSDRNVNVIGMATDNAQRAGVAATFTPQAVSALTRPDGPAGLVITNPPYGARVGKKNDLYALYGAFGEKMRAEFKGWRVAMVTSDGQLANATKLPWLPLSAPIAHGGLKVRLYQTEPLR